jgi:hypothetical protein
MKTIFKLVSILATFALWPAIQSKAEVEISLNFFYDNLDPYGDWVEVGDYGYCWHPHDIDNDWRPYTSGHWVYTDAGWTWVSDEPYAWAVYHYGRWSRVNRVGWVWVPDTEWGPAWVSWRRGDRYVGWAPLPPESRARVGVSIGGWADAEFDIGPTYYSFVDTRDLGAPHLRSVILPPQENLTIINRTTNITNISYRNNVVINNGPDYNAVAREVKQPIRRLRLERRQEIGDLRTARAEQLIPKEQGDALVVAAPPVQKAPDAKPKKFAQKIEKAEIDRGWKDAGEPKQVETVRAKIKEEAKTKSATASQEPAPPVPPAETATPSKGERPSTAQESTAPVPEREPAKPGKGKGKAPDRRRTAAEPGVPAKPGESVTTTTEESTPPKTATPEQRGIASKTEAPVRGGKKQPGKKVGRPEAIAEEPQLPTEKEAQSRPTRPETPPEAGRPGSPQQPEPNVKQRSGRNAREQQPAVPERQNRREQAQPERPNTPDRDRFERPAPPERSAQPERPNLPEQARRTAPERSPVGGGPAREARPQRPEQPEVTPPQRPPQPAQPGVQGRGPGKGKAPQGEEERKKKGAQEE